MQIAVREQEQPRKATRKARRLTVRYEARPGFRVGVSAEVVGPRIETLKARNNGHVTPAEVVEDATPEDSPLHGAFTWDEAAAAHKCRLAEARNLIRSYEVIRIEDGREESPVIANVRVHLQDVGSVYVSSARAMADPELREQVLGEIRGFIRGMQARYRHLPGIRDVVLQAVDEMLPG